MNQEQQAAAEAAARAEAEALTEEQLAYEQMQDPNFTIGTFNNVAQGLTGHYRNTMLAYWQETINAIENNDHEFKIHQLPLARIKKVMKADEEVNMISAEAPILFAKGCDIFITELTMRAWIHAEENKRRTLQRSDIASALQKSDMFDFLIDIVPREEAMLSSSSAAARRAQQQAAAEAAAQAQAQAEAEGYEQYEGQEMVEGEEEEESETDQYQQQQQQQQQLEQLQQQQMLEENRIYGEYRGYQ